MDNTQTRLASSALAIFTMAILFFGGLAATETFAQKEEVGKEEGTVATQPSVLPAPDTGEQFTEVEIIITGDFVDQIAEERPDIGEAIENAGEQVATNATAQNPEVLGEIEIIITGFEEEVAQNNTAVAETLPAEVNATGVLGEAAEIVIVEQVLENEGVDVNAPGVNATEALQNVDITASDIETAAGQVTEEGTLEQEVTAVAVTEPGKEETTTTTAPIINTAVENEAEEAAPEIAEQTGQEEETVRALLERALVLLG